MPAAAVIPALIAYINVVVVKKLVVENQQRTAGLHRWITGWFVCHEVYLSVQVPLTGCLCGCTALL